MKRWSVLLACAALTCACSSSPAQESLSPVISPAGAPAVDAGIIALGAEYVTKRGCPQCHQSTNASDGILSGRTTPLFGTEVYPPNLTPDPDSGLGKWSDDDIALAVRDGFAPGLQVLCFQMSRFDRMSDDEIKAIIAYLRHLPAVKHEIPPSICPPIRTDRDGN